MATEKLAEGIRGFAKDIVLLERPPRSFFFFRNGISHPHMCVHACTCWTWARYEGIIKEKLK